VKDLYIEVYKTLKKEVERAVEDGKNFLFQGMAKIDIFKMTFLWYWVYTLRHTTSLFL
jgi:hypothetical protein